jgi:hypothetical protein
MPAFGRTFNDVGPGSQPTTKRIAIEVNFPMALDEPKSLDLDAVHLIDERTKIDYGGRPRVQRLTNQGEPADSQDPIFTGTNNYRCLLVYEVSRNCTHVQLKSGGRLLNVRPLILQPGWPVIPVEHVEPLGLMAAGQSDGDDRYALLVACRNWSRVRTPKDLVLHCLTSHKTTAAKIDGYVELGRDLALVQTELATQPLYIPERWFLIAFHCPHGAQPVEVRLGDRSSNLPVAAELKLSATAFAALSRVARDERNAADLP